jgi:hypothetical protein
MNLIKVYCMSEGKYHNDISLYNQYMLIIIFLSLQTAHIFCIGLGSVVTVSEST